MPITILNIGTYKYTISWGIVRQGKNRQNWAEWKLGGVIFRVNTKTKENYS